MSIREVIQRVREGGNVSIPEAAEVIGCSPNHLWKLVRDGKIEAVKVGRSVFLPSRVTAPLIGLDLRGSLTKEAA